MRHTRLLTTLLASAVACAIATSAFAATAAPIRNANTTLTITPSPVTLSGDAAADAIGDTLTTSATLSTATIDQGKVTLEMATLSGAPALITTPGAGWTNLPPWWFVAVNVRGSANEAA